MLARCRTNTYKHADTAESMLHDFIERFSNEKMR
jgi:hypothetical protein